MSLYCLCPHLHTPTGWQRSGWHADCQFHGREVRTEPIQLNSTTAVLTTTSNNTKTPCRHCKGTGFEEPTL